MEWAVMSGHTICRTHKRTLQFDWLSISLTFSTSTHPSQHFYTRSTSKRPTNVNLNIRWKGDGPYKVFFLQPYRTYERFTLYWQVRSSTYEHADTCNLIYCKCKLPLTRRNNSVQTRCTKASEHCGKYRSRIMHIICVEGSWTLHVSVHRA